MPTHPNDDTELELLTLQHAGFYDKDTRQTTAHRRSCYPRATFRQTQFTKDQASDFTLLSTNARAYTSSTFDLPNALLTRNRTDVLTYVEMLERMATTTTNPNLHDLVAINEDLNLARTNNFSAIFPLFTSAARPTPPKPKLILPTTQRSNGSDSFSQNLS